MTTRDLSSVDASGSTSGPPATKLGRDKASKPKPPSAKRLLSLIAANVSVLAAALVYMGWAYQNAEYGHFGLNPQELNVGIVEYMLYGLDSFRQVLLIAAVIVIAAVASFAACQEARARRRARRETAMPSAGEPDHPDRGREGDVRRPPRPRPEQLLASFSFVTTLLFGGLWLADVHLDSYVYLAVFGIGPLLFTRTYRFHDSGRFGYATAIALAAVCAVYAGALYANAEGLQLAKKISGGGGTLPRVTVYSRQPLGLSGNGIRSEPLLSGSGYRWRYEGLRLLTIRSGSYYLFPTRPTTGPEPTYILDDSDGIRIVLNG